MRNRRQKNSASIFAPVAALAFSSGQYDTFQKFLAERAANTECVPVVDARQLALTADGCLADSGYRFNPIGFEAVCRVMCPGLVAVFNDISGENCPYQLRPERPASLSAAVGIYNAVLGVRLDALRERSLLIDHREQSIDGFLGLEHRFFDNSSFFNLVVRVLSEFQPQAVFSRAELVGRALRLFFILPETRRQDLHPDANHSFAAGWCFSNREDAGNAIRAGHCIFTRFGPAVAAASSSTRVVHAGADIVGRTSAMLARVVSTYPDMATVGEQVKILRRMPLNFSQIKTEHDSAQRVWVDLLGQFGVKSDIARAIVKNAAVVGADLTPQDPIAAYSGARLSSRTGYDLLCSILRYSRHEYATCRDLLQAVALSLLTAKNSLNRKKKFRSTSGGVSNAKNSISGGGGS